MARTRLLHPEFFKHDGLAQMPPLHRLLFQALWTIADREGRLEDRPMRIKIESLPYDDCDVDEMLADLARAGFIMRYSVAGGRFIAIPTWDRWQQPHVKEKQSEIPGFRDPGASTVPIPDKHPDNLPVSVSVSVSNSVSVSDPTDSAQSAEKPPVPESAFVAFVRSNWPDLKKAVEYERLAREAFPAVDLLAEAKKAFGWEHSDVRRRKRSHGKFLWGWLGRAQDSASRGLGGAKQQASSSRGAIAPSPHEAFAGGGKVAL